MDDIEGAIGPDVFLDSDKGGKIFPANSARHRYGLAANIRPVLDSGQELRVQPDRRIKQMNFVAPLGQRRNRIRDMAADPGMNGFRNEADLQPVRGFVRSRRERRRSAALFDDPDGWRHSERLMAVQSEIPRNRIIYPAKGNLS